MPNWCANSLKLTATTQENKDLIARMVAALKHADETEESPRLFSLVKPCPDALLNTVAGFLGNTEEQAALVAQQEVNCRVYGYPNWYEFQVSEWGTKWEASDVFWSVDGDTLYLNFDTAWSPPIGIYEALENMGFEVEAGFVEQGVSYIGYYKDGVDHTENIQYETKEDQDEEDYSDPFDLSEYFSTNYGMSHAPSHFGG